MTLRREFKHIGKTVNAVGYGAMSLSNFYGPIDHKGCLDIVAACYDLGVDHLDTANLYGRGNSETVIGEYLRDNPAARDFFTIATKGGIWIGDPNQGNDGFPNNNGKTFLEKCLDESLQKLGIDCVDIYYLHRWDQRLPIEEVTEILAGFVKAGKCKGIGFSEIAPSSIRRAAAVHPVTAVQSEYSLWTRLPELGVLQACEEVGATMVAFSPLGRGMLTDTYHSLEKAQTLPFLQNNPRFMSPNYEANVAHIDRFRQYARDLGWSTAGLANAWTLAKGEHVLPIPGTRHKAHLAQCVQAMNTALSPDQVEEIERILPVGFAHGDRYSDAQYKGQERYC